MGHDKWYVALPENSELLARAQIDPAFGEYLSSVSLFEKGGAGCRTWDESGREFCDMVRKLNEGHPGLKERVYSLERHYDVLHYLLSEARRRGAYDYGDWATQAILGATALPDHLRGGQGHPMRYSPAAIVQENAIWLELVTPDSLHEFYNPVAMRGQAVYKITQIASDGREWALIWTLFAAWKAFYQEAAKHSEGVLVVTV